MGRNIDGLFPNLLGRKFNHCYCSVMLKMEQLGDDSYGISSWASETVP